MGRTVTLDSDVEQLMLEAMQGAQRSFDETLNDVVRRALSARPPRIRPGSESADLHSLNDDLESAEYTRKTRLMVDGLQ